jgi:hypothetical protein
VSERRVRVSAGLYRCALYDAIDWVESLIASRSEHPHDVEQNAKDRRLLARYRQALAALDGAAKPAPPSRTVTLAELSQRNH